MSISSDPPALDEHHVRVPDQLAKILGADTAHRNGITGRGVRIAVIDSGFFPHPFYENRGYKIQTIETDREPEPRKDLYGHGTAQLASLLALAPEAEIIAVKCLERDPTYAIERALEFSPQILSCAWGFNIDRPGRKSLPKEYRPMHAMLQSAIAQGICVVAAAGNGQFSFPGSMPEVISAGAVFYGPDHRFYPSDLSSRFESSIFPKRRVPDICGLAGNLPHGRLLLVPIPPDSKLARRQSARLRKNEGWAMLSGTSAATAMVSGAAALLLQQDSSLTPAQVRAVLIEGSTELSESGCRVMDIAKSVATLATPALTSDGRPDDLL